MRNFDLKRWLSVLSACTLGWSCGFIIYTTIVSVAMVREGQSNVPTMNPGQQAQSLAYPKWGGSIGGSHQSALRHAVVRIVNPAGEYLLRAEQNGSPPQTIYMMTQPVRSFYL